jgi:hypothetical protein
MFGIIRSYNGGVFTPDGCQDKLKKNSFSILKACSSGQDKNIQQFNYTYSRK